METKQAESLLQQNQPALAGFVLLDPEFESGSPLFAAPFVP